MASGVEELLDMLFEMIDEAKNAAFTSDKCVIERDRALDLIDDIRSQFPIELAEAQKIMANRNELLASAKREAESIRKAAEDKARQLLADHGEQLAIYADAIKGMFGKAPARVVIYSLPLGAAVDMTASLDTADA